MAQRPSDDMNAFRELFRKAKYVVVLTGKLFSDISVAVAVDGMRCSTFLFRCWNQCGKRCTDISRSGWPLADIPSHGFGIASRIQKEPVAGVGILPLSSRIGADKEAKCGKRAWHS